LIEILQEFTNIFSVRLIGKAIHGRFDIQDIKANSIGILLSLLIFYIKKIFNNFKS
jgi:glycopeptide antibiotics resistance protein